MAMAAMQRVRATSRRRTPPSAMMYSCWITEAMAKVAATFPARSSCSVMYKQDLFLNSFFHFGEMPIPDTTRQGHQPVVKGQGLVAVDLRDAAQALGPADGVFYLDASAGMGAIIGALGVVQRRVRRLFAAPGLAVGQAIRGHVVVAHQTQVAQIGQPGEQVQQAQVDVQLVFQQLVVVGRPAAGRPQVVDVTGRVGEERVFTGGPFFCPSSRPAGPRRPAPGGRGVRWRRARPPARPQKRPAAGPVSRWPAPAARPTCASNAPGPWPGDGRVRRLWSVARPKVAPSTSKVG